MPTKHIMHIGFPRCGSTWVWSHLYPHFNCYRSNEKEISLLQDTPDVSRYVEYYKEKTIGLNFNPNNWMIDQHLIKQLNKVVTHVSITLRSPYEFTERYFDYIESNKTAEEFTNFLLDQGMLRYVDIIKRWTNNLDASFSICLFDDLADNPKKFLQDYYDFCNLNIAIDQSINYNKPINQTKKSTKSQIIFSDNQKKIINHEIEKFQQLVNRSLEHWIK